jgi:hypothetical protein
MSLVLVVEDDDFLRPLIEEIPDEGPRCGYR